MKLVNTDTQNSSFSRVGYSNKFNMLRLVIDENSKGRTIIRDYYNVPKEVFEAFLEKSAYDVYRNFLSEKKYHRHTPK